MLACLQYQEISNSKPLKRYSVLFGGFGLKGCRAGRGQGYQLEKLVTELSTLLLMVPGQQHGQGVVWSRHVDLASFSVP